MHDAFMFLKRTFNAVNVIAVSVRHRGDDLVIPGSRVAKKHIWNAGHHFTNAELAHHPSPKLEDLLHLSFCCCGKPQRTLRQKEGKRSIISWRTQADVAVN